MRRHDTRQQQQASDSHVAYHAKSHVDIQLDWTVWFLCLSRCDTCNLFWRTNDCIPCCAYYLLLAVGVQASERPGRIGCVWSIDSNVLVIKPCTITIYDLEREWVLCGYFVHPVHIDIGLIKTEKRKVIHNEEKEVRHRARTTHTEPNHNITNNFLCHKINNTRCDHFQKSP